VNVVLEKKSTMLELVFKHEGNVPCDLTSEDFDLPIQGEMKLLVRFGDITMIMRLLVLPFGEFELDIAQYIYEMIAFCSFKTGSSRCTRRKFKTEALERLKELILEEHKGEVDEDKTQDKREY
jgi:hypothetical protein